MPVTNNVEEIIHFIWRFGRDKAGHENELKIKTGLLKVYVKEHSQCKSIIRLDLYPVERLGFGGSKVFYLDVTYDRPGPSERYVAKFNSAEKTYREYESANIAKSLSFCSEIYSSHEQEDKEDKEDKEAKYGLLVYKFAKLSHSRATEFRAFYLNKRYSKEDCAQVLTNLYNKTIHLQPDELLSGESVSLINNYAWYYNRATGPLNKLKQLSAGMDPDSEFSTKSKKIIDFHTLLTTTKRYTDIEVKSIFQHGDLHARNILLDPEKIEIPPDLIDFDWAGFAHAGRDFAVLEATVKYMLIQEFSSENLTGVDKHSAPISYINFERLLCDCELSFPENADELSAQYGIKENVSIMRAYECIKTIRENAKRFLECSFDQDRPITEEKEYFIALFLISIGHIAFDSSDDYWVLNGCNILIDKIKCMGWLNEN